MAVARPGRREKSVAVSDLERGPRSGENMANGGVSRLSEPVSGGIVSARKSAPQDGNEEDKATSNFAFDLKIVEDIASQFDEGSGFACWSTV